MRPLVGPVAFLLAVLLSLQAGAGPEPVRKTHPLSVSGRALDAGGAPVTGATIFLVSTSGIAEILGQTVADEDGRYVFHELPLPIPAPANRAYFEHGSFRVLGRAPGHACAWHAVKHLFLDPRFKFDPTAPACGYYPDENIALDLTFEKPYAVTGRIVDETGRPIAGAKVTMTDCRSFGEQRDGRQSTDHQSLAWHDGARFLPEVFAMKSDKDGQFDFQAIALEKYCSFTVEHPDYTRGWARVATSNNPPKQERDSSLRSLPLTITLQWKRTIPVHVSWADTGRPAAGVSVLAIHEPRAMLGEGGRGLTDQDGNVTLRLPRGNYRLRGEPLAESGYVTSELVFQADEAPPAQPFSLPIQRGARLTFKVVDAKTGKGVPEASIWYMERQGGRIDIGSIGTPPGYRMTNLEGELRTVVPPGTRHYGLSYSSQSYYQIADPAEGNAGRELSIAAGESATIEFKASLRPGVEPPVDDEPVAASNEPEAITGRVAYDGPPPPNKLIGGMIASARGGMYGPPLFDDSVLVDAETRGLANVVIYFDRTPAGMTVPAAARSRVTMSVLEGRFEPRISLLRRAQTCSLTNRDPDVTNVHIQTLANSGVNQLIAPHTTITWRFDKPERPPIMIQSDIRPGMKAYQVVTDHPWVAVTDKTGKFAIRGLPPGKYQFKVWHEAGDYLEKALVVEVKPGAPTKLDLTYSPARFGR